MPAFFHAAVGDFPTIATDFALHHLTSGVVAEGFDLSPQQHIAWSVELPLLTKTFSQLSENLPASKDWRVLLEYPIPGRRKRIDLVILTDKGIVVVEFKTTESSIAAAKWQVREYCWNLRDFHQKSRNVEIAPIVCIIETEIALRDAPQQFSDRHNLVLDVATCDADGLANSIEKVYRSFRHEWSVNPSDWNNSPIEPTPSVIEFAQKLFAGHDVREISHAHADNTDEAVSEIHKAIRTAQKEMRRIICFVTGVPGAGKTLVGLNTAYRKEIITTVGSPVCFASGNQPLLDVIEAALVMNRLRARGELHQLAHDVGAPVQNVHEFARNSLVREGDAPPAFRVVVFDEAQRVWNAEKLTEGLEKRRRRGQLTAAQVERLLLHGRSEPELLLSLMERCADWCVVVALIGGGQEIYDGEAGIAEWGKALRGRIKNWSVWVSAEALNGGPSNAHQRIFEDEVPKQLDVRVVDRLHLAVAKRSRRAERYADWVNAVVSGDSKSARTISKHLEEFPVYLTRDINLARGVIRAHCPPDLRCGLLASSGAVRLRADGIEVSADFRNGIKFPDWFLRPYGDIRSSSALEVAATEFECQGLELDWCCVCWGGDFVMIPKSHDWKFRKLRSPAGKRPLWYAETDRQTCEFIRNKYRVLLTRSRTGVVLFVPQGDENDPTREHHMFDGTAEFLAECGALVSSSGIT